MKQYTVAKEDPIFDDFKKALDALPRYFRYTIHEKEKEDLNSPFLVLMELVLVKQNHPLARPPVKAYPGDAGFDFFAVEDAVVLPGERAVVDTGLSFAFAANLELQVRPRSGLAAKSGITVLNSPGTIDSGYRGSVKVVLFNTSSKAFSICPGDRIAQGVFCWLPTPVFKVVDELPESERNTGGFGSTGT